MLEVVEHEQCRPLAQVVKELFLRREAAVSAVHRELDRLRNRRRKQLRRCHRNERDEVHAVRVALDPARGGLERKPGLARTARPDEREQTTVGLLEQPVDLVQLRHAADERRARGRQVLRARLDRLQQREVTTELVHLELVDALRRAQILEPVDAQVANSRVHERTGRLRQEHLPAVPDRGDPRPLVHVEADVSLLCQPGLARVQPHPNANRSIRQRTLAIGRGGNGIRRAGEGDEERIALRVDLDALVLRERRPQTPPMLLQRLAIAVLELAQQPRRALHVREQQRHDAGREITRHAHDHRAKPLGCPARLVSARPKQPRRGCTTSVFRTRRSAGDRTAPRTRHVLTTPRSRKRTERARRAAPRPLRGLPARATVARPAR